MRLEIRASDLKDWFQYRCERQLIYASMPIEDRDRLPVEVVRDPGVRAREGEAFEAEVVRALRRSGCAVLGPRPGQSMVDGEELQAFLRGKRRETYVHQAGLYETGTLRRDLRLPDAVSVRAGRPDLLRWVDDPEAGRRLQVIDIKHTRRPTQPHRAQVAFYSLMLRGMLADSGLDPGQVHPRGSIWHIGDGSGIWSDERGAFDLSSREEMLRDFFRRHLPRIADTRVAPGQDESFFHLYFKCEQCQWLEHCERSIADDRPRETWDLSAVPGMSHRSKKVLHRAGLRTVQALAEADRVSDETWALRTRGKLLSGRARALVERAWRRLPGHHTWLMPARVDVPIFLVVDRDPVAGHLVTLGCRVGGARAQPAAIEVVTRPTDELRAIKRVLGLLVSTLEALDRHNARVGEAEGLRAHIFVYETSEANDLRDALAGHLDDPGIRGGLLDLVRLFPPEEVRAPEPEYRGAHHLPASALRSVMEQLYVLPTKVSYDLARVSRALCDATPPLSDPYRPAERFARRFSARLSIDVARGLAGDAALIEEVRQDVRARLAAMEGLCAWVLADNAAAEQPFLRLRKPPFRFQAQFHPLDAIDLDVLLAQELLQSRADRLATLVELARPFSERRERLRCLAELELVDRAFKNGKTVLTFRVPERSRHAEIGPGSFGLILTDDDPDLRMDPARWPECEVRLRATRGADRVQVEIERRIWNGPTMRALSEKTPADGWFIDQVHSDINTPRIEAFLRFLSGGGR